MPAMRLSRRFPTIALLGVLLVGCASSSSPDQLSGTSWVLHSVNGDMALPHHRPALTFGDDNSLTGYSGCSDFDGNYRAGSESFSARRIVSAGSACTDADAIPQEEAFFQALKDARQYGITGDVLTLNARDGSVLASFIPAHPLAGTRWFVTSLRGNAVYPAHRSLYITFGESGSFGGTGGCNELFGEYSADLTTLDINLGLTALACFDADDPERIMNQEDRFVSDLGYAAGYLILNDTLVLYGSYGETLMTFE